MNRLGKLCMLGILLGWAVFLSSPPLAQADCISCDLTYNNAIATCNSQYNLCQQGSSSSQCDGLYATCAGDAAYNYNQCLQSCAGSGSGGGSGTPNRNPCNKQCNDAYGRCVANGGVNSPSFQTCMTSGWQDVDDCCFEERSICLSIC